MGGGQGAAVHARGVWAVVHAELLSRMPEEVLAAGDGHVDAVWCGLLDHALYNCTPPWMLSHRAVVGAHRALPECTGVACAYSFVTPLRHLDTHEINGASGALHNVTLVGATHRAARLHRVHDNNVGLRWLSRTRPALPVMHEGARFDDWKMNPTWRPHGTMLTTKPCWHADELGDALSGLYGTPAGAVAAAAQADALTAQEEARKAQVRKAQVRKAQLRKKRLSPHSNPHLPHTQPCSHRISPNGQERRPSPEAEALKADVINPKSGLRYVRGEAYNKGRSGSAAASLGKKAAAAAAARRRLRRP